MSTSDRACISEASHRQDIAKIGKCPGAKDMQGSFSHGFACISQVQERSTCDAVHILQMFCCYHL